LRYAAMVSTLTFKRAVEIHQQYLDKRCIDKSAEEEILNFLGWSDSFGELVTLVQSLKLPRVKGIK
ncbi:MAG: hypothetical protein WA902_21240, partial [Thermosynechococcaceae cyanobacterium]